MAVLGPVKRAHGKWSQGCEETPGLCHFEHPRGELSETNSVSCGSPQLWSLPPQPHRTDPPQDPTYTSASIIHVPGRVISPKPQISIYMFRPIPMLRGTTQMRSSVFKEMATMIPYNPKTLRTDHTSHRGHCEYNNNKMNKSSLLIQSSCVHLGYATKGSRNTESRVEKLMEANDFVLFLAQKTWAVCIICNALRLKRDALGS